MEVLTNPCRGAGGMYILANSAENASGGYVRGEDEIKEKRIVLYKCGLMDECLNKFYNWIIQGSACPTIEERSQHIDYFDGSINRNDWLRRSLSFYKDGCRFINREQLNISMCLALYLKDNYIGRVIPNRLSTSVIHKIIPPEFVLFRGFFLQKYHEEELIRCDNLCTFYDYNVFFTEYKLGGDRQYARIIHFVDTTMS